MHLAFNWSLPVVLLLLCSTSSVSGLGLLTGPETPVQAHIGDDVILPCQLKYTSMSRNMELHWTKTEEDYYCIILQIYKNGSVENKHKKFINRTNLFHTEFGSGNVSIMISEVQVSDSGEYICQVRSGRLMHELSIKLEVLEHGKPELGKRIEELEKKNQELEKKNQELEHGKPEMGKRIEELEKKNQELENKNQELEHGKPELEMRIEELEKKNQELEKENQELETDVTACEKELKEKKTDVTTRIFVSEHGFLTGLDTSVQAYVGDDVILSCKLMSTSTLRNMELYWTKTREDNSIIVQVYKKDLVENQCKKFTNRTNLFHTEFGSGNFSMHISKVLVSDAGEYTCHVKSGELWDELLIKLEVSEIKAEESSFFSLHTTIWQTVAVSFTTWLALPLAVFVGILIGFLILKEMRIEELEKKNQELENKNQELEKENPELEHGKPELEMRIEELEKKNQELEHGKSEPEMRIEELEKKTQELKKENQELGDYSLKENILLIFVPYHWNMENQNLNMENQNLNMENQNLNMENQNLNMENQNLNMENQNLNMENQNLNMENQNLNMENQNLNMENQNLNMENQNLNMENQNLNMENQNLNMENQNLNMENQNLNMENQNLNMENQNLNMENQNLNMENQNLNMENQNLNMENQNLNMENQNLVSHLS
ncbi:girdin-like [Latimeria chalumnae]|uniref:girdin-like n=1 Tax=Latimeria chalumnae TaxID=7897 RepID=UPI00313E500F